MGDWQGFTIESKSWMNYDGLTKRQKFAFWRGFAGAYFRFRFAFPLLDRVKVWRLRREISREE